MSKDKRGGPGRGQGRKPIKAGETTVSVSTRMTKGQRDKLKQIGGGSFVRRKIDAAKVHPTSKKDNGHVEE